MVLAIEDRGTTFWCTICFRNILEFKFYADLMFPLQIFSLLLTLNFLFAHLTLMQLCASHNILNLFQICIFKLLFLDLVMKAVYIQGLWVVAPFHICCMCTLFTNIHFYLSAGSTASHSVLAHLFCKEKLQSTAKKNGAHNLWSCPHFKVIFWLKKCLFLSVWFV